MVGADKIKAREGIVSGLCAGGIFLLAQMAISLFRGQPLSAPLHLIASVPLGLQAVSGRFSFPAVLLTAVIVQAALSALWGLVFAALVSLTEADGEGRARFALNGMLFGLFVWLVDMRLIAPALFPQLRLMDGFWGGFLAYTFFFGLPLGLLYSLIAGARQKPAYKEVHYGAYSGSYRSGV
ncbi:MAG: hypothetical protein ACM3OC_07605 [Deltaproteobacteria bacterium]